MHEIVRLRGENRNLRGETSREDAFDVLSELLDVQRGAMATCMTGCRMRMHQINES